MPAVFLLYVVTYPHIRIYLHSSVLVTSPQPFYLSTIAVIWGIFRTFEGYCFNHI
ncbi:hypothetical protein MuYL_1788 [Mucilaginibacter xinganensis]|uniref:Uncharacterized protein n=1 Tax=Mucilaginibacter xinganensis TaxID=1234841 RepID=A0A223NVI3_9SPHI|nr:hypothetical protein MuYL_1788 [Mucilaginibacter xinganensis]